MRLGLSVSGRKSKIVFSLFILLLILGTILIVLIRLKPAFMNYAGKYANNLANNIVNEAVSEVFADETYSSLSRTGTSGVKTVETDTAKVNKLKSDLNKSISDKLKTCRNEKIGIPLGTATDFYFLAGIGPEIPIKVYPIGVSKIDVRESFEEAGINQVYYRLYLDVSVEMSFVSLTFTQHENLETTVLISETIIVGDTPQYYGSGIVSTPQTERIFD